MAKKLKIKPETLTLEQVQALAREGGRAVQDLGKNYAEDVAALERDFGPGTPALIIQRGRPRKDQAVEPVQVRAIKMPPIFWETLQAQAEAEGMTLHAAMRAALVEWSTRHRAG